MGKNLTLYNLVPNDAGTYMCLISLYDNMDMMDGMDIDYLNTLDLDNDFAKELVLTLKVRSRPGPVANLTVRISTILGVLKWDFEKNNTGGYPLKSFTAQFRKYIDPDLNCTNSSELEWDRLDPRNIPSNVVSNHLYEYERIFFDNIYIYIC